MHVQLAVNRQPGYRQETRRANTVLLRLEELTLLARRPGTLLEELASENNTIQA